MTSFPLSATTNRPVGALTPLVRDRALRVLHCIPTLALGGAQRAVIEIIRHLTPTIEQRLAVLGGPESAVEWPSLAMEPQFLNYSGSLRQIRRRHATVGRIASLIEDQRIDVVHSHLWGAATVCGAAAARQRVPHVVHVQDTRPWVRGRQPRDALQRWWIRRSLSASQTLFLPVSQATWTYNSQPLGLETCDYRVIPNGANTEEFRPPAEPRAACSAGETLRVGVAARFNPEKGHGHLIRAVATLRDEGLPLSLHLAGDGSLLESCRQLAADLGIADWVEFIGLTTDIPGFLQTLDVFVLPSLACEGLPLSILEAMAAGVPVIVTDVGGTSEVVVDGTNGLLVAPDDVDALAVALRTLTGDPDLRKKLSCSASDLVRQRYSWRKIAAEIEQLYRQMAGQRA